MNTRCGHFECICGTFRLKKNRHVRDFEVFFGDLRLKGRTNYILKGGRGYLIVLLHGRI